MMLDTDIIEQARKDDRIEVTQNGCSQVRSTDNETNENVALEFPRLG